MDKRKTKKGRVEYRVRWRGYGSEGDTWEPEPHLSTCMVYVHDFNRQHAERQRAGALLRSTRSSPSLHGAAPRPYRPPPGAAHGDVIGGGAGLTAHDPPKGSDPPGPARPSPAPLRPAPCGPRRPDPLGPGPAAPTRRNVDLAKTGIKILVPRSPMDRPDAEDSPREAARGLEAGAQEAHPVPPEVALLEKPGVQLGPGEERARMGTRPRSQNLLPPPRVPITPAAMRSLTGNPPHTHTGLGQRSKQTGSGFLIATVRLQTGSRLTVGTLRSAARF